MLLRDVYSSNAENAQSIIWRSRRSVTLEVGVWLHLVSCLSGFCLRHSYTAGTRKLYLTSDGIVLRETDQNNFPAMCGIWMKSVAEENFIFQSEVLPWLSSGCGSSYGIDHPQDLIWSLVILFSDGRCQRTQEGQSQDSFCICKAPESEISARTDETSWLLQESSWIFFSLPDF